MNVKSHWIYDLIIFGFPFLLIAFESLFRGLMHADTLNFMGPAIASSGLSILASNIKPKPVTLSDHKIVEALKNSDIKVMVRHPKDELIIAISWLVLLIGMGVWFWVCIVAQ